MSPTSLDTRPLYEQVAEALRRTVARGDLGPGDPIPSETELRKQHGVSRDTVRKALTALTQEGVLTGSQGRIRYVRAYAPLRWTLSEFESQNRYDEAASEHSAVDAWSAEVTRQGRQPAETLELSIVQPAQKIAERLGVDAADMVVVRRRIRYVDDQPCQLADSYFPESLVRGTPLMEPQSVSARGGVLASIGHPQTRYLDEIAVRMPTPAESDRLDLPSGTPVAEVTRTGFAQDGTPLRVMVSVAPGDRNILVYESDVT